MTYRFRVGVRPLAASSPNPTSSEVINSAWQKLASHACFLLNTDLFEYSGHGYVRRKNVGRDAEFDWDMLGNKINGTTHVSPDQLEQAIKNAGEWLGQEYDLGYHNCHGFVRFCLDKVGADYFFKRWDKAMMKVYGQNKYTTTLGSYTAKGLSILYDISSEFGKQILANDI
ncbi:hypothetical protein M9Y10_026450 [Tritrichomonas musculus]|uniref:LRAT domain-containing protein n=1 Tax=Tritrichomonas musculus TaxID=1915356 RepID=A0ABR2H7K8_9EUKA